jgi:hypothetical protein
MLLALLNRGQNENIMVLDWGRLSAAGLTLGNLIETASAYVNVLGNVGPAGGRVADFLEFLRKNVNIDQSKVHIIGHSLGAHICESIIDELKRKHKSKIRDGDLTHF